MKNKIFAFLLVILYALWLLYVMPLFLVREFGRLQMQEIFIIGIIATIFFGLLIIYIFIRIRIGWKFAILFFLLGVLIYYSLYPKDYSGNFGYYSKSCNCLGLLIPGSSEEGRELPSKPTLKPRKLFCIGLPTKCEQYCKKSDCRKENYDCGIEGEIIDGEDEECCPGVQEVLIPDYVSGRIIGCINCGNGVCLGVEKQHNFCPQDCEK